MSVVALGDVNSGADSPAITPAAAAWGGDYFYRHDTAVVKLTLQSCVGIIIMHLELRIMMRCYRYPITHLGAVVPVPTTTTVQDLEKPNQTPVLEDCRADVKRGLGFGFRTPVARCRSGCADAVLFWREFQYAVSCA